VQRVTSFPVGSGHMMPKNALLKQVKGHSGSFQKRPPLGLFFCEIFYFYKVNVQITYFVSNISRRTLIGSNLCLLDYPCIIFKKKNMLW